MEIKMELTRRILASCLVCAGLVAVAGCSSCQSGGKGNAKGENANDSMEVVSDTADASSSYVPVRIPSFVRNLYPGSDWYADTICVANGTAYYLGYEDYGRAEVIFTQKKLLLSAPMIYLDLAEVAKRSRKAEGKSNNAAGKGGKMKENTRFRVYNAAKSVVVDFTDTKSLRKLEVFSQVLPSFARYQCDTVANFGKNVRYNFVADFPEASLRSGGAIMAWLIGLVERSLTVVGEDGAHKRVKIGQSKKGRAHWPQAEAQKDNKRVANMAAKAYFARIKKEYAGLSAEDWPSALYSGINLQAVVFNERFVTYQVRTNEYNGGAHGYYTERLASYDYVHHREIDCNYLFRPQCMKDVLSVLIDEGKKTPKYQEWQPNIEDFVIGKGNSGSSVQASSASGTSSSGSVGKISLPTPGLSDEGVVFSFQPYDISCFAAGTFHFVIPYSRIKPYLTPMALWCLGLK